MSEYRFSTVAQLEQHNDSKIKKKHYLTGGKLKSGQTLNGHNSIIFKYYEKKKYRFESKFNLANLI